MDVRTYLRAIRKSWWALVLCIVLGGGAAYAYSAHSTPVYAASVQFFVGTQSSDSTNAQSSDQFAQSRAISYAKLLSSGLTARAVVDYDHAIGLSAGQVAGEITGSADINTVIVDATVEDTSKARALRIAEALSAKFPAVATSVEPVQTSQSTSVNLRVTDFPSVNPTPVSPRTKLNVLLGVAAGLIIGLLIAVLRFLRDTSVRTRDDIEAIGGAPLVGDIVFDSTARNAPLVLERQSRSLRAEAFRQLRTNLQFVDAAEALRVIVVTSSTESEGKSTTAANLALMFAETGRSVVLVGADLRRPRVSEYLSIERAVGLTNVLVNQVSLDDALQPWGSDGLHVLASGAVPPNPSELLGSPHMLDVLEDLRRRFDLVVIDTPPLLPVTDAAVLAVHADGVVVVCRHGKTRRAQLTSAVRSLQSVNARVVGMVLNMRPVRDPDSERYGSYQYYSETPRRDVRFWRRSVSAAQRENPAVGPAPIMFPLRPAVPSRPVDAGSSATGQTDAGFAERIGASAPGGAGELSPAARAAYDRRRARSGRRARLRIPALGVRHGSGDAIDTARVGDDAVDSTVTADDVLDSAVNADDVLDSDVVDAGWPAEEDLAREDLDDADLDDADLDDAELVEDDLDDAELDEELVDADLDDDLDDADLATLLDRRSDDESDSEHADDTDDTGRGVVLDGADAADGAHDAAPVNGSTNGHAAHVPNGAVEAGDGDDLDEHARALETLRARLAATRR